MAARKLTDKLIKRETILEELRLIEGSETDYITPTGKIYKDYGNDNFYPKSVFQNKVNNYLYCNITYPEGQKQKRVHILVAQAYVVNPDPTKYSIVMHKDNDKTNCNAENLEWGTIQQNTADAYRDGLAKNDKGWDDSQSLPVSCFDINKNHIADYGSIGEAARATGYSKNGVSMQCNHLANGTPRKGFYFRFLSEYQEKGFVL